MSRLFQIYEDDLADLERTLPLLCDLSHMNVDNAARTSIRRVQEILKNVRWNYGPPHHVERIPPVGHADSDWSDGA